ncbi:alpha-1,6-mannosyltransferase [Herbihabitans rhizosphaerae]|uniref:Alpha-1,6-mannosyltransferase n=1 Tax=Herbihabitans rhizosphaerae TaxID=1872711 RepID=A0A4V2EU85_9PSEU|nr:polyprenol phosphomannose-dependent alpha 1,6 mannosyltransferase MptB [Herbihabitans rhizosphaerae]RZS43693.1 alpha-1,6-mannosyltransferase [Herbihabitans rhizosphaerae]
MPTTPSSASDSDASTDTAPDGATAQAAAPVAPSTPADPAPTKPFPYRTTILGLVGSLMILLGGLGAAGILVHDPILGNGPLSWLRYGHGQMLATGVLYLGFGFVVWAWVRMGRYVLAGDVDTRSVLIAAGCWIAPLIIAPPVFTRDVFSYLGQGTLPLYGYDPYEVGPIVLDLPAVVQNVHEFWQTTPAPYGPMFILVAKAVAWISGSNMILGVILMRLAMSTGIVLVLISLPGLVRHLGGKLSVATWLAIASPMTVVHLIGGPHNDSLMLGFLAAGTLLVLNRHHVLGIALVTAAMGVKPTAALALPFLIWVWAGHLKSTQWRNFARAMVLGVSTFVVTFGAITLVAGVNLGWLPALRAPAMIVNWLSLPTAVGEFFYWLTDFVVDVDKTPFIVVTRIIGALLFFYIAIRQWWAARHGGVEAVRRMTLVLFAIAVLSPATLPWYLTWGLVIAAAMPWQPRQLVYVVTGSVFLVLVYSPAGEDLLYNWPFIISAIGVSLLAGQSLRKADPLRLFSVGKQPSPSP